MMVDVNIARWKEMSDLTFELADTLYTLLDAMIDYCRKNNIPIHEAEGLWNLVTKTRAIFREIEETSSSTFKASDGFLQRRKSDKDFTAPYFDRFLFLACCLR